MATPDDNGSTKLHIDLPNHWATGGESLWAKILGNDLYEIDNVPFHIYGLNYRDVVRATSASPDLKPEIREVVRPSGHRTLRVVFPDHTAKDTRIPFLQTLTKYGATFENKDSTLFAIDVAPEGDYPGLCEHLQQLEDNGFVSYESCEARLPGSFDDLPQEDDPESNAS
jgi:hypothetical protein